MPRDSGPTRRRIVEAAEILFARQGLDVPLQDITRAAGQRNAGAIHYHFGGREGLLRAIVEQHVPLVYARRQALLATARECPEDLSGYARAIVLPITELLNGSPADRAYLQISVELLRDATSPVTPLLGGEDVQEVVDAVAAARPALTATALQTRAFLVTQMVGMLCAARAARHSRPPRPDGIVSTGLLDPEAFDQHLTAIVAGALAGG
ncbi:TetR/AcrR family transcriptional regulator [Embleya sp. NBC_00896]|uniref:TetR/AcrR family transcriptional regulator n=1 Tax=Embleya sp. NBC_00896 TaxID=2975961 RepID=UPI00386E60DC|nr:TetR/AcrR family transcriptional regulator [Embleya sp. NBC_00896]